MGQEINYFDYLLVTCCKSIFGIIHVLLFVLKITGWNYLLNRSLIRRKKERSGDVREYQSYDLSCLVD